MPSDAYTQFRTKLLSDVDELIKVHKELKTGNPGRQGLGHINRSALILLCAGWEHYLELVCLNFIETIIKRNAIMSLDKTMLKSFSAFVKTYKTDELFCLKLIGKGWENCLIEFIELKVKGFNTPKMANIISLITDTLGIDISKVITEAQGEKIDQFVTKRGAIAHIGAKATYPNINEVIKYRDEICHLIMTIDDFLAMEGKNIFNAKAWRKIAKGTKIKMIKNKK